MQSHSDPLDLKEPDQNGSIDRNRAILNYIRKSLRATRPWTRFLSVLGFIGTGLTIVVGIFMLIGKDFIPASETALPLGFLGILYILTSVFYLIPSIWLAKYSSAISAFLRAGDAIELGRAIAYQKSFWKFVGILALVSILFAALGIMAAILIPTLLTLRG